MKILKIRKFTFFSSLMLYSIPLVFFLLLSLFYVYNFGVHIYELVFLAVLSPLTFFVVFVINYYLFDKDTVIKIDENGNVAYNNNNKMYFHLQDIDLCIESCSRFPVGYTEIVFKNGFCLYVTDYISLEPIYKMNPNIKKEHLEFFRPKILRREKLVTIPDNHQN